MEMDPLLKEKHFLGYDVRALAERIEVYSAGESVHVNVVSVSARGFVTLRDDRDDLSEDVIDREAHYARVSKADFDLGRRVERVRIVLAQRKGRRDRPACCLYRERKL